MVAGGRGWNRDRVQWENMGMKGFARLFAYIFFASSLSHSSLPKVSFWRYNETYLHCDAVVREMVGILLESGDNGDCCKGKST